MKVEVLCPRCGTPVTLSSRHRGAKLSGRFPDHHVDVESKSFARVRGDLTAHFFDYRERCGLSGALFTLELRS